MTDPIPPSRGKRRLLLAGAGVGGPLIGLLLLMTVFGGDEVAVGVAAPVPRPAQSTTVPAPARDEASLLAATADPFHQLVTVPGASGAAGDAAPSEGGSVVGPAVDDNEDFGAVAGPAVDDEPFDFGGSDSSGLVTDEAAGEPLAISDEVVREVPAPEPSVSPPTTGLPAPTTSPPTLPPTTSTVPPTTTTTPPPTTTATSTTTTTIATTTSTTSTTVGAPKPGIVFAGVSDGNQDVYTIDPAGGAPLRLTNHPAADRDPAWSPDGTKIAFVSDRTLRPELFVMGADGTGQVRVSANAGSPARPSWGRDGESLVFASTDAATGGRELFLLALRTGVVRRLTAGACTGNLVRVCPGGDIAHGDPAISPDGTWIAFVRRDRNGQHLLVMKLNGTEVRSLGGVRAANPAWTPDGRTIAFDDRDGIRVVSAGGGGHEVVAATSTACSANRCPVFFEPSWSPDGTRLIVRDANPGTTAGDLYVIDLHGPQRTTLTTGAQASGPGWFSPSAPVAHALTISGDPNK